MIDLFKLDSNQELAMEGFIRDFLQIPRVADLPSFSRIFDEQFLPVSEANNRTEASGISHFHSEVLSIARAQEKIQSRYLNNFTLITSLEPCLMCGAIILSRLKKVIYLVRNTKAEGISSLSPEQIYLKNHFPELLYHPDSRVKEKFEVFFNSLRSF